MKTNTRLILNRPLEPDSHPAMVLDRGKDGDGVRDWVWLQKHRLLATYIDAARSAAKSPKFSNWIYIDPFCGAGRMQGRDERFTRPSGAMVAWRQSQISNTAFDQVLVGDFDRSKLDACQARLEAVGCKVKAFHGKAEDTVNEMIRQVPPRSLCLVYIDPYNLSLLSYQMLKTLASLPKVDFVVHFSTMDWLWNTANATNPANPRLDEVSPGWRDRLAGVSNSSLPVALFSDWYSNIEALDFKFAKAHPIYNNSQSEIYKLVFFARHELPIKLWGDVARDQNMGLFD